MNWKIIKRGLYVVLFLSLVLMLQPIRPTVIISESMEPLLLTDSLVFTNIAAKFEDLQVGEIIRYTHPEHGAVIHRVYQISDINGKRFIMTKGDNNTFIDPWLVQDDWYTAKMVGSWNGVQPFIWTIFGDFTKLSSTDILVRMSMLSVFAVCLVFGVLIGAKYLFNLRRSNVMNDNNEIVMTNSYGRKKSDRKTTFSGVVSKVFLSSLVLSLTVGAMTPQAFAAEVNTRGYESVDAVVSEVQTVEDALIVARNTLQTLSALKEKGEVNTESLRALASCIHDLEKVSSASNKEAVEKVLNEAENLITGVNVLGVSEVQIAIDMARESLTGVSTLRATQVYNAATNKTFSDVPSTYWASEVIYDLVGMGAISGYTDGTFKPSKTISYAEYLAILVRTTKAGSGSYIASEGEPWYNAILSAAYESGIAKSSEVKDPSASITRKEAAKFTERAVEIVLGEKEVTLDNVENLMKDFNLIEGTEYEYYVLQQYSRGIVSGTTGGTFNPNSNLTRAEASAIIIRTVKTENRRDMSKVSIPAQAERTEQTIQPGQNHETPQVGDTFIKSDGSKVILKEGPSGVLGEGIGENIWAGMKYVNGENLKDGMLSDGTIHEHVGEVFKVDKYGEGHFRCEWNKIRTQTNPNGTVAGTKDNEVKNIWWVWLSSVQEWVWTGPTY